MVRITYRLKLMHIAYGPQLVDNIYTLKFLVLPTN